MMKSCMLLITTCLIIITSLTGISSNELVEGPLDIARTIGETFVVIPCPFSGIYEVIWKIDNIIYNNVMPIEYHGTQLSVVSSGLLIPIITEELEGQTVTFQCFYPNPYSLDVHSSSIGSLTVTRPSPLISSYFDDNMDLYETLFGQQSIQLGLDHQRLVFGERNKTFAWKSGYVYSTGLLSDSDSGTSCNMYKIKSQEGCLAVCDNNQCDLQSIFEESVGNETIVTIENELLYDNNSNLVRFNIIEVGSAPNCTTMTLEAMFQVKDTVKTEVILASSSVKIMLEKYTAWSVVIPTSEDIPDCHCPIIFPDNEQCFWFIKCSCINQTAFNDNMSELKVCKTDSEEYPFVLQISNLTQEINRTKLHIYMGYDKCKCESIFLCQYREYVKAFVILHVLPEPPDISQTNATTFCFNSPNVQGISVDSYEVIITDNTRQQLYKQLYSNQDCHSDSQINENQIMCSPYTAFVTATNSFGSSSLKKELNNMLPQSMRNPCSCFKSRVDTVLNVTQNVQSLAVDIVEIEYSYVSPANYEIRLSSFNNGNTTNYNNVSRSENVTATFEDLSCEEGYILQLYWIPISLDLQSECLLNETMATPKCSSKSDNVNILIIITSTVALTIILSILIITIAVWIWRSKSHRLIITAVHSKKFESGAYGSIKSHGTSKSN